MVRPGTLWDLISTQWPRNVSTEKFAMRGLRRLAMASYLGQERRGAAGAAALMTAARASSCICEACAAGAGESKSRVGALDARPLVLRYYLPVTVQTVAPFPARLALPARSPKSE